MLVISIPCILSCIFSFFVLRDSPRLLLNKDQFHEAVAELRTLAQKSDTEFSHHDEEKLKKEVVSYKSKNIDFSFSMLFSKQFCDLTIINLLLLLCTSMAYVSNFFSLPLILYKEEKQSPTMLSHIIIAQSFSIPAIILASLIAGLPNLGRKPTIMIGFALCFLIAMYSSIFQKGVVVTCALINFFIMVAYFLGKVYLIESFPSKLRDHGMSFIFVIVRLGESIAPSICELAFRESLFGPLEFIALLTFVGFIVACLIPFETRGEALDSKI